MLYFTILRDASQVVVGPLDGSAERNMQCDFYSTEVIVGTTEAGQTRVYFVKEIRSESSAAISGYCVEGESQT